ncbi:MAG: aminopeptidase P family protein [Bradymonadales bacterium]|jgi:Xaa-Pro aminopeptidase
MDRRYKERRRRLREAVPNGDIILLSSRYVPRNYEDNTYPFHQDSCFYYYTGLGKISDAILQIAEDGTETLYAADADYEDVIWTGPQARVSELAEAAGIERSEDIGEIFRKNLNRPHFLKPYDALHEMMLSTLWRGWRYSQELHRAIIAQRSVKDAWEIEQIEEAIALTGEMLKSAQSAIAVGRKESEVGAALLLPALAKARQQAFNPIVSVRGETLHNESMQNTMQDGDILLIDCGAESEAGYCADITRVYPVDGELDERQRAIYDIVLSMQTASIAKSAERGVSMLEVHMAACRALVKGMSELGLMRANQGEALAAGAHALFFPHGIGHMLGLDAHDMENLGDEVGYDRGVARNKQFGLHALRMAKTLKPGYVVTVEPGIYFIPELIARWEAKGLHSEFIDYARVKEYIGFGGIRIEDDVLITEQGSRVLGEPVPK